MMKELSISTQGCWPAEVAETSILTHRKEGVCPHADIVGELLFFGLPKFANMVNFNL
jgi:hypothetical protein